MSKTYRETFDLKPMSAFQWQAVLICMVINMIDGFDVLVTAFTASAISADWHLTGSQLGVLLSAGLIGMAAGSLFIAPLADKLGRRPVILGCLGIASTGMMLASIAASATVLAVLRAVTGLGVGGILACSNVIASEYASKRWRGLAVSLQSTGYALGATLGGAFSVWLLSNYGWHSVFLFGGGATLIVALLVMAKLPESIDFLLARRPINALNRLNKLHAAMGLKNIEALPPNEATTSKQGNALMKLLSPEIRRATVLVWLSFFMVMFGFYFVMSWTPKLLSSSGLTQQQGVTAGVLLSLGGIVGTSLLGLLAARFQVKSILITFLFATALLLLSFVNSSYPVSASLTLAFLIGAFVNGCVAGLYAVGPLVYPAYVRAAGLGTGIGIGRIGAILSPIVAGNLIDKAWVPSTLYSAYSLSFAAAGFVVMMHKLGPKDDSVQSGTKN